MKTYKLLKKTVVVSFASIILACGAETLAIVFIPAFAAFWPVKGDENHTIELRPVGENLGVESGVFGGKETDFPFDTDGLENPLTGKFNGLNIEFTIQRDDGNVKYSGKMTPVSDEDHNITKIEVSSSAGNLVLEF